jgi:hypothetical protein
MRQRHGVIRFKVFQATYEESLESVQKALGPSALTPHGPKATRCPPPRPSATHSGAAVPAGGRPADGNR